MRRLSHSLLTFGILFVTLAATSHAETLQADSAVPKSVAQAPPIHLAPQIPVTPERSCQALDGTSNFTPVAPVPQAGLCGAACRASCRDECWQMGRTCKPDCVPTICECYCNCG